MGRSTTSCFKIISCGGSDESVDRDDINASSENKDKRGWSFRKRSARHRVLSNTVINETPVENKTSSEPVTVTSEPQVNSSISEKACDSIWTEELPQLSNSIKKDAAVSTMATEASCEDDIKSESVPDESAILVIQAAIRRFLAQRELVRHKNVVKLQAAVRGHLVRNHAVGTLRCVQAIVKMQALVRSRRADLSSEINSDPKYISIEKLLSNSLARQLLESTPKTKQINIKCVPSKSDSAWNWLERWMSVSSPETVETHAPEQNHDQDQEKVDSTGNEVQTVTPDCESTEMELESNVAEETVAVVEKENLVNAEEKSNEKNHEEENPQPTNTNKNTQKPDDVLEETMDLIVEKPVSETEPKRVTKRLATDEADSEGRKSVFGSRKASNPSFIAAQSRFEELTSKNNPLKPIDSSKQENDDHTPEDISPSDPLKPVHKSFNQEMTSENTPSKPFDTSKQESDDRTPADISEDISPSDPLKPVNDSPNQESTSKNEKSGPFDSSKQENDDRTPEDISPSEPFKPINNSSNLDREVNSSAPEEYLVSECGTELSITSTLDSPDQSEVETKKLPEESKVSNEEIDDTNGDNNNNIKNIEEHNDGDKTEKLNPAKYVATSVTEQKLDDTPSEADIEIELEPNSGHQIPEASSPRSHITAPESQGTPNSQLSTNTKSKKASSQKRKSWSTSKKSTVDSGLRSSLENLPKESKPGKRRNSFGSPRPDKSDHEGNGLLPSYMQATESARAKAIANASPRSSPDVQDKEIYLKKRHSLPGAVNGRQGSPRIQRSVSQALESTKGNGNQERKWQR